MKIDEFHDEIGEGIFSLIFYADRIRAFQPG